jgi:hypothetical protein
VRTPDGKVDVRSLGGSGAHKDAVPTHDGATVKWKVPAPGGLVIVQATEPTSPATGQLWYDTDATC